MSIYKHRAVIEISPEVEGPYRAVLERALKALDLVDSLYSLELAERCFPQLERAIYSEITTALLGASNLLEGGEGDEGSKGGAGAELRRQVEGLRGGAHDLRAVTVPREGRDYINLLLGKVISTERGLRPMWAGAVGAANDQFAEFIASYDRGVKKLIQSTPLKGYKICSSDWEGVNEMRCVDVLRYAGELDRLHKPICVFYSEGEPQNLSTLSNMVVFINLYTLRFRFLSMEIARKHFADFDPLRELDDYTISKLLLLWLRGHDLGHFLGSDNLRGEMDELDPHYLILHEFKSDMASLFSMKHLGAEFLPGDSLTKAYFLTLAEMFRYIRRGYFLRYPDSASAYLAYRYFKETGSLRVEENTKRFRFDLEKLQRDVEELLAELLNIFERADVEGARNLVNRWGDLTMMNPKGLPPDVAFLWEGDIPHCLDLELSLEADGLR